MASPDPGWYDDGTNPRWWDGLRWGPDAPQRHPDEADKTAPLIAHFGPFAGGFLPPLVVHLMNRNRGGSFARHHGAEALDRLGSAASRLERWRYPVSIRLIGTRSRSE